MDKTTKKLEVTPLSTLKGYARGELVEFPPFAENQPFVARIKRPSMMMLMKTTKIPNELLSAANSLFSKEDNDIDESKIDPDYYKQVLEVIEILAGASFVEPTWEELKGAGIELTDEQYAFLFNYTQIGVKALEPFREEPEGAGSDQPCDDVSNKAKQHDGN